MMNTSLMAYHANPPIILMNGKGPFGHQMTKDHESFTVTKGNQKAKWENIILQIIEFDPLGHWSL